MQDKPRASELLEAIADFLMKEVMPAVRGSDALSYKTLVSWNMLGVIAREFKEGEALAREEFARLAALPELEAKEAPANYPELLESLTQLNEELAGKIRQGGWHQDRKDVWQAVKAGLEEKLRISNPRFGTQ